MKKFMVMAAGLMMAAVLGACAPTARNTGETSEHGTAPAGAAQQETVDGVAEKESMVVTDADPTVTVCVYSVKSDKSGLKQNMDGMSWMHRNCLIRWQRWASLKRESPWINLSRRTAP